MPPSLTIIIPTIARPSLYQSLLSIKRQTLLENDEVIVVGDGEQPLAHKMLVHSGLKGEYFFTNKSRNWGHHQRNEAMPRAKGDFLMFLDDDDVFVPGVFDQVRNILTRPGLYIFKVLWLWGRILPNHPEICNKNITTSGIVVSNVPDKLGVWGKQYNGDLDFAKSAAAKWESSVYFPNLIISHYRGKISNEQFPEIKLL